MLAAWHILLSDQSNHASSVAIKKDGTETELANCSVFIIILRLFTVIR